MGHRLSKTTLSGSNAATNKSQRKRNSGKVHTAPAVESVTISQSELNNSSVNLDQLKRIINVITDAHLRLEALADPNTSHNNHRQIVIKIQLAKMEPGDNDSTSPSTSSADVITGSNNNLNVERSNVTLNAIRFRRNIACDQENETKLNNLNVRPSVIFNNNNFVSNFATVPYMDEDRVQNINILMQRLEDCAIVYNDSDSGQGSNNNESGSNRSSTSSGEFSEVAQEADTAGAACSATTEGRPTACGEEGKTHCCRRKKSSSLPSTPSSSNAMSASSSASKWRYCKYTCRDAFKNLRPNSSKKQNQLPSNRRNSEMQPLAAASPFPNEMPPTTGNHLAIWSPANDVIIPLVSPQIVVVQYPPPTAGSHLVTLFGDLAVPPPQPQPDSSNSIAASPSSTMSTVTTPNGTVVHSQVDYIHCLVPDLEKITKSTFYWGKMDRYEAERLLEGKPEGTFLLRDSAQEEYLFSVTFRKYGRSLHARIEQFNHRFSFDCHDPGVFTAPTVTGLLEHYKDPFCVMFFEPMLAIPLHRNTTFSLQQLCRATIVSHTTYDGITEMEIPSRLKSYLKEYHYKQRVRVKPFDETIYSCT